MYKQPQLSLIYEIDWFTEGNRIQDWMHPGYGPFPDLCYVIHDDNLPFMIDPVNRKPYKNPRGWFTAAAWNESGSIIVMVWEGEGTQGTSTDDYHQGVAQSYRWRPEDKTRLLWCCNVGESLRIEHDVGVGSTLKSLIYASATIYCSY